MAHDLDYAPLTRRQSMADRLRAVKASNIWVYSMTLGVLLTLLPSLVLVGVIPVADMSDPGFVVLMGMLAGAGVFVIVSVLYQVGGDGALGAFARANHLELTQGSAATHYAGSLFLDGTLLVHRSVRT